MANITVERTDAEATKNERKSDGMDRKRTRRRRIMLLFGPLVVLVGALTLYLIGGRYVSVDNAYVKAGMLNVSTDVAGTVVEVAVRENQPVTAGQLLYRLDDEPFRIAVAGAKAHLAAAQNDIEAQRALYRQKLADIAQAEADVEFYEKEYKRQATLAGNRFASESQYDAARHNLASARQKLASLRQEAQGVLANLGGDPDKPVESHPDYLAAKAQLDEALRNLEHTRVVAPFDGIATQVDSVQVGQYLPAATPAFSLVSTEKVWIEANPKETDLAHIRSGQPVTVEVDAYPDYEWHGVVAGVSPASGGEFAVLPPQNASGNWIKVVQRIPLRVALEPTRGAPPLRSGMSATIEIDTGRSHSIFDLVGTAQADTEHERNPFEPKTAP